MINKNVTFKWICLFTDGISTCCALWTPHWLVKRGPSTFPTQLSLTGTDMKALHGQQMNTPTLITDKLGVSSVQRISLLRGSNLFEAGCWSQLPSQTIHWQVPLSSPRTDAISLRSQSPRQAGTKNKFTSTSPTSCHALLWRNLLRRTRCNITRSSK